MSWTLFRAGMLSSFWRCNGWAGQWFLRAAALRGCVCVLHRVSGSLKGRMLSRYLSTNFLVVKRRGTGLRAPALKQGRRGWTKDPTPTSGSPRHCVRRRVVPGVLSLVRRQHLRRNGAVAGAAVPQLTVAVQAPALDHGVRRRRAHDHTRVIAADAQQTKAPPRLETDTAGLAIALWSCCRAGRSCWRPSTSRSRRSPRAPTWPSPPSTSTTPLHIIHCVGAARIDGLPARPLRVHGPRSVH